MLVELIRNMIAAVVGLIILLVIVFVIVVGVSAYCFGPIGAIIAFVVLCGILRTIGESNGFVD